MKKYTRCIYILPFLWLLIYDMCCMYNSINTVIQQNITLKSHHLKHKLLPIVIIILQIVNKYVFGYIFVLDFLSILYDLSIVNCYGKWIFYGKAYTTQGGSKQSLGEK